jgi:hypothetical protein
MEEMMNTENDSKQLSHQRTRSWYELNIHLETNTINFFDNTYHRIIKAPHEGDVADDTKTHIDSQDRYVFTLQDGIPKYSLSSRESDSSTDYDSEKNTNECLCELEKGLACEDVGISSEVINDKLDILSALKSEFKSGFLSKIIQRESQKKSEKDKTTNLLNQAKINNFKKHLQRIRKKNRVIRKKNRVIRKKNRVIRKKYSISQNA